MLKRCFWRSQCSRGHSPMRTVIMINNETALKGDTSYHHIYLRTPHKPHKMKSNPFHRSRHVIRVAWFHNHCLIQTLFFCEQRIELFPLMGRGHMVKTSRTVSERSALQSKRRLLQNIYCNLIVSVHRIWKEAFPLEGTGELTHAVK